MSDIAGYRLGDRLHAGRSSVVFKAVRPNDGTRVVIKQPAADYPSARALDRLRAEFDILRRFDDPRIVRALHLVQHGNSLALILEHAPGLTLREHLIGRALPIAEVLQIATGIAAALSVVHAAEVIHKDVNPNNIIVDPAARTVKLIDFNLAAALRREAGDAGGLRDLEGTLAYMAPEQTGRTIGWIDHRSDLYALGATLYAMLTGEPPFASADPIEVIHHHIARVPTPPHARCADVPQALSRVVMRLLAKSPEQRYQSAAGLLSDLETCLDAVNAGCPVPDFELGSADFSARFQVPERLYGRAAEVERLLAAFDESAAGSVVLALVSGYSGAGKSSVVGEVMKPILERRGRFAMGKLNQFGRDQPFAPLIAALRSLVREVLASGDTEVVEWRYRILGAVGPNGRVLTEVIPEVAAIIGEQPAAPELPPRESKNRFQRVFREFLSVFCQPEHPLTLFLDDLQWVDAATLEWLEDTVSHRDLGALFVIGAYRDNEVSASHALICAVDRLRAAGRRVEHIELAPLDVAAVTQLVADTLHRPPGAVSDLVDLVHEKTHGNPFFVIQVLESLHASGVIRYDPAGRRWAYAIEAARGAAISDNVVDLMVGRLERLPEPVRDLLKLAAVIGNRFGLRTLLVVTGGERDTVRRALAIALEAGLLLGAGSAADGDDDAYRFLHDRVQQAAASLMSVDETAAANLRIGRLLRDVTPDLANDARLFSVLRHLNVARALLTDAAEREQLSQLNLAAAARARRSAAHGPALAYAEVATELRAQPTFELLHERAWCEHLGGRADQADGWFQRALALAPDDASRARGYESRVHTRADQGKFAEAYGIAREGAARFGVDVPARFVPQLLALDLVRARVRLGRRAIAELADLPELADDRLRYGCRLVSAGLKAAYQIRPELCVANAATVAAITLKHGNFDDMPLSFLAVGCIFVGAVMGRHKEGEEWGRLVLALVERPRALRFKAEVNFVYGYFMSSWSRPLAETEAHFRTAWQWGIDTGDHFHVGCACSGIVQGMLMRGAPLDAVWKESEAQLELCRRIGAAENEGTIVAIRQGIRNLRGETRSRASFDDAEFDEARFVEGLARWGSPHFAHIYHAMKLQALYLWGELDAAAALVASAERYLRASDGTQHAVEHELYEALLAAAQPARSGAARKLARARRRFERWARDCPESFQHKALLLAAEQARVEGDADAAFRRYDEAIEAAGLHGFPQNHALACELAGRFHLAKDRRHSARYYLREAAYGYHQWGATALAAAVVERYPVLAGVGLPSSSEATKVITTTATSSTSGTAASVDLATFVKAAQAISGELRLREFLASLLGIVMENAGADRGVLLLPGADELLVQAERRLGAGSSEVLQGTPLSRCDDVARSVIQFVARTRESVVLADAAAASQFARDPHIAAKKPRSLLCVPLVNQGKLAAVAYLENHLTAGAFTADRLEVLTLLSAQAALSIQSALLYARLEEHSQTLEQRVADRTRELIDKNAELGRTLEELRSTQKQLISQEKLASLGALTAGIAHEIRNPLNFVTNFAELSTRLTDELTEGLDSQRSRLTDGVAEQVEEVLTELRDNLHKISEHGRNANRILAGMLMHSRDAPAAREEADLNRLVADSIALASHGLRRSPASADITIDAQYGPGVGHIHVAAADVSRVFVNVINNACYAIGQKRVKQPGFIPRLTVRTCDLGARVEVRVRDNGTGIPPAIQSKLFIPFFTTKPPGEGAGLGLSISHDIVVGHQGSMKVESIEGEFTEIVIELPRAGSV